MPQLRTGTLRQLQKNIFPKRINNAHKLHAAIEALETRRLLAVHIAFDFVGGSDAGQFKPGSDARTALDAARTSIESRLGGTLSPSSAAASTQIFLDPFTRGNTTDTLGKIFPQGLTL